MATEAELDAELARVNDSILQQRAALLKAGEIPTAPGRPSFAARLAKLPAPTEPTEEDAHRAAVEADAKRVREANERAEAVALQAGRRYLGASLETFKATTPEQKQVVAKLTEYVADLKHHVKSGVGIVLLGPPGTGKDHLIVAVLKLAAAAGFSAKYVDGIDLYADARDRIDTTETERRWTERYTECDILAISDPIPPVGMVREGQQIATLWRIVNNRYRAGRPTLLTINAADRKEAADKTSENIVDRLSDNAIVLRCIWPSYRKPKQ